MQEQLALQFEPVVGQLVTVDEASRIDNSRYSLHWRPDNLARVGLRTVDTTGMVQCNLSSTCQVAEICAHGRPHIPTEHDALSDRCYDHKPYIVGGVTVWSVPVSQR